MPPVIPQIPSIDPLTPQVTNRYMIRVRFNLSFFSIL